MLIPQAIATDKYSIYVRDSNNNIVSNAQVEVWISNYIYDHGSTNENGIFYSYLDNTINYHIIAKGNGQNGDWQGYPTGDVINVNMHT